MLLTTANGQPREKDGKVGREGGKSESSPTTAGPISFHCVPHKMPIHGASGCWGGGRETPTYTKQRSLLCCSQREGRGRVRVRQEGKERCEDRNYEYLPEKCRCFSK